MLSTLSRHEDFNTAQQVTVKFTWLVFCAGKGRISISIFLLFLYSKRNVFSLLLFHKSKVVCFMNVTIIVKRSKVDIRDSEIVWQCCRKYRVGQQHNGFVELQWMKFPWRSLFISISTSFEKRTHVMIVDIDVWFSACRM